MNDRNSNSHDDERFHEEFELTAAEKKALEELPRDRIPSDSLEKRVVSVLRERGLLAQPRRRVIELTVWRFVAAAAACLVLLATGFVLGQRAGSRQFTSDDPVTQGSDDFSIAASLQQTGTAYLIALQRLANVPDAKNSDAVVQGQEVALTSLCTAAEKVSQMVPKDVLSGQLLASLDRGTSCRKSGDGIIVDHNRIIEF